MKIKNLYEINTVDIGKLRTHKFYVEDEEIKKYYGREGDYYYLRELEIKIEGVLRSLGLKGEEKEKKRVEILKSYIKGGNKHDIDSVIKTYLDSDMRTEVARDE